MNFAMTDDPKPPVIIAAFPSPGEPEMIEFFFTLGNAVNRWAFVDRVLFKIFRFSLKLDQRQTALFYYAERALNRRIDLVYSSLKSVLPSAQFEEWKTLAKELKTLSHVRNVFVHHPVKRFGASDGVKPIYKWSIHIEPYEKLLNRDYPGLEGKDELFTEDLKDHVSKIEHLEEELRKFYLRITA